MPGPWIIDPRPAATATCTPTFNLCLNSRTLSLGRHPSERGPSLKKKFSRKIFCQKILTQKNTCRGPLKITPELFPDLKIHPPTNSEPRN